MVDIWPCMSRILQPLVNGELYRMQVVKSHEIMQLIDHECSVVVQFMILINL